MAGCSTVQTRQNILLSNPQQQVQTNEKLKRFYGWLLKTEQLLSPVRPYRRPRPDRYASEPKSKTPSAEEITKGLNRLLKDPAFKKAFGKGGERV